MLRGGGRRKDITKYQHLLSTTCSALGLVSTLSHVITLSNSTQVRDCDPYLNRRSVRLREVKEVAREVAKLTQFKWQSQVLISG